MSNPGTLAAAIPAAPRWQLRLVGGAIGTLLPLALAVVAAPAYTLQVVAAVGVPVGMAVGVALAPTIVVAERPGPAIVRAGALAVAMGSIGYAIAVGILDAAGATIVDLARGITGGAAFALLALPISAPTAFLVAWIAVLLLRRVARRAAVLWIPSLLVVGAVIVGIGLLLARVVA